MEVNLHPGRTANKNTAVQKQKRLVAPGRFTYLREVNRGDNDNMLDDWNCDLRSLKEMDLLVNTAEERLLMLVYMLTTYTLKVSKV